MFNYYLGNMGKIGNEESVLGHWRVHHSEQTA